MRKYCLVILLLSLLVSCEDMFYREVNLDIAKEEERLVLGGNFDLTGMPYPNIYVSHSYMLGTDYSNNHGVIYDADVSVSVNGKSYDSCLVYKGRNYAFPSLEFKARDEVEVRVSYDGYPAACVKQKVPDVVTGRMCSCDFLPNRMVRVVLELDAYNGADEDMIGIALSTGKVTASRYKKIQKNIVVKYTDNLNFWAIFSTDEIFASASNMSANGYYGVYSGEYLYIPASALRQPHCFELLLDYYWSTYDNMSEYSNFTINEIEFKVVASSYDTYLYRKSKLAYEDDEGLSPPLGYFYTPYDDENPIEDMLEELGEMLGGQEPKKVYGNVEGGFGCICFENSIMITNKGL